MADTLNTNSTTTIIDPKSISFESIVNNLVKYVQAKPDEDRWKDFLESSAGQTIIELIAGLAAYTSYNKIMMTRESDLDTAIMDTSIIEKANDKGFLVPTTNTGVISIECKFGVDTTIIKGNLIGTVSDYELYAEETYIVKKDEVKSIRAVVGHLNEFDNSITKFGPFDKFVFQLKDRYPASQFESLYVDGLEVALRSGLNNYREDDTGFVLRSVFPSEVRIYTGNGILGFFQKNATTLKYVVLTYGEDLEGKMDSPVSLLIPASLISQSVISTPDYSITKEDIRGIARFFPIDGRIVVDKDYEVVLLKYFGGIIRDVYSYNSDPNQELCIIIKDGTTEEDIQEIRKTIDTKRGLGIRVNYHISEESDGKIIEASFTTNSKNYTAQLESDIPIFLSSLCFKFMRDVRVYRTVDLATEISAYYGFPFKPADENETQVDFLDFIKEFKVKVTPVDTLTTNNFNPLS